MTDRTSKDEMHEEFGRWIIRDDTQRPALWDAFVAGWNARGQSETSTALFDRFPELTLFQKKEGHILALLPNGTTAVAQYPPEKTSAPRSWTCAVCGFEWVSPKREYCPQCHPPEEVSDKCEHGIPRRFCTAVHES